MSAKNLYFSNDPVHKNFLTILARSLQIDKEILNVDMLKEDIFYMTDFMRVILLALERSLYFQASSLLQTFSRRNLKSRILLFVSIRGSAKNPSFPSIMHIPNYWHNLSCADLLLLVIAPTTLSMSTNDVVGETIGLPWQI